MFRGTSRTDELSVGHSALDYIEHDTVSESRMASNKDEIR